MNACEEIARGVAAADQACALVPIRMAINSELAAALLRRNTFNRPLHKPRAMRYRADMNSGAWCDNGETMKVDTLGRMVDGQHRLAAIVGTDLVVPTFVVFGIKPDAVRTIDQHAVRRKPAARRARGARIGAAGAARGQGRHLSGVA